MNWQSIETAPDDHPVLVANPAAGSMPVIAWKIQGEWIEWGIYGHRLRPAPTLWTRWPTLHGAAAASTREERS